MSLISTFLHGRVLKTKDSPPQRIEKLSTTCLLLKEMDFEQDWVKMGMEITY